MLMSQNELLEFFSVLNRDYIGPLLAVILLGTGLFYTFRLHFVQRHFFRAFRLLFRGGAGKASRKEGMSPFQALATSIASQVGTGNIVGVATALMAGDPGAIFWLWGSTLVGMPTNFAEAVLGQLYKSEIFHCHLPLLLCFQHHRGVVLLCRAERALPFRRTAGVALPLRGGSRHTGRFGGAGQLGLGAGRYVQLLPYYS